MWSNYGKKSVPEAGQSVKDHICLTKPFLLKMGCDISGWRFLKFWFFYCIPSFSSKGICRYECKNHRNCLSSIVYVETWPSKRMTVSSLILKGVKITVWSKIEISLMMPCKSCALNFINQHLDNIRKKHVCFQIIVTAVWETECQWNFVWWLSFATKI